MSESRIKEWIDQNRADMEALEEQGDTRDWIAYEEIQRENELLEVVLNDN